MKRKKSRSHQIKVNDNYYQLLKIDKWNEYIKENNITYRDGFGFWYNEKTHKRTKRITPFNSPEQLNSSHVIWYSEDVMVNKLKEGLRDEILIDCFDRINIKLNSIQPTSIEDIDDLEKQNDEPFLYVLEKFKLLVKDIEDNYIRRKLIKTFSQFNYNQNFPRLIKSVKEYEGMLIYNPILYKLPDGKSYLKHNQSKKYYEKINIDDYKTNDIYKLIRRHRIYMLRTTNGYAMEMLGLIDLYYENKKYAKGKEQFKQLEKLLENDNVPLTKINNLFDEFFDEVNKTFHYS